MRSLAMLLESAVQRSANEVVLESGQPTVYSTPSGQQVDQAVLPSAELFDMIVAAVDDGQQVELAIGNPVEFRLDAGGPWSVFAEPHSEGVTVRAWFEGPSRSGVPIELGVDLDSRSIDIQLGEFGRAAALPQLDDDEFAFEAEAPAPPARAPARAPAPRSPELRVEALEVPVLDEPAPAYPPTPAPTPIPESAAAPFESGTWALADEDDFDADLQDSEDSGARPLPTPAESTYTAATREIGVPVDDDDDAFDDDDDDDDSPFASPVVRMESERPSPARASPARPTVAEVAVAKPAVVPPLTREPPGTRQDLGWAKSSAPVPAETPTRREAAVTLPSTPTRQDMGTIEVGLPDAGTKDDLPPATSDALASVALQIDEGALVFVHEPGLAERLAQSFAVPALTIDDEVTTELVWDQLQSLPLGSILVVRREDPSSLLAWLLRRLEEGYRVFIETRARSFEGARRILLGIAANDRAERWLDQQVVIVIEAGETGPRVHRAH